MFILYGLGANGKSTLMELLRSLLGDYASNTPFSTFLTRDTEKVRNDLARLAGARFVSSIELRAGQRLDEVVVKQVTGGDTITARFLFREYFEFAPQFKLWLAANHKPIIKGVDDAIWRRVILIPFEIAIPEAEQDKKLLLKLQAELPGVLAWAVRGCLEWQDYGLESPIEVRAATATYREEMDVLGGFLSECLVEAPGSKITAKALYEKYTKWCEENGEKSIDPRWFGRNLSDRGYKQGPRTGQQRTWVDIDLGK
jgi:putative DNA primase/helicase